MKRYQNIVLAVVTAGIVFFGCQKDEKNPGKKNESSISSIDKSRLDIIADLSKEYENAVIEALSERSQLKRSGVLSESFDISDRINTLFAVKCSDYQSSLPASSLKSSTEEPAMDATLLQSKLDDISNQWLAMMESLGDIDKEDFLAKMQSVSANFVATVEKDNSLTDTEKQIVVENVVFRTNMAIITLNYGEEIQDFHMSQQGLISWFKKNVKKIGCSLSSIAAVGVCSGSVLATIAFQPVAIPGWGACVATTASAAKCW